MILLKTLHWLTFWFYCFIVEYLYIYIISSSFYCLFFMYKTTLKSCDTTNQFFDNNIYAPPPGLSSLAKELRVTTSVIQSSLNELRTSISDSIKCKQTKVNTYTLNSLTCVLSAIGWGVCYWSDVKFGGFRFQLETSRQSSYNEESWYKEIICGWLYIYIYIYIY